MARVILATLRGAGGFEKKLVVKQIRDELAFDQQFVRRFVEEAKTTVALSHPNIVPVYELGVEQGTYFLAMELVEGVSVAELIRERNADGSRRVLTPEEGAYIGVEVCRALDYAHRRMKVVHRDITPRNVMIDEEGQVKLIDFGIAAPALVAGHEILGSPGHMAPEQVDGGELGPSTDIFALAVLLMEAWTGSAPFRRATPEECAAAVREPHPKPSDFDARLLPLDDAISAAMNVDPKKRQQDASDLGRVFRAFLQGVDVGDLARALGDRVRELREEVESPSPPSRTTAPRASAASHGDLGTKTFAARDESTWSNPPPRNSDPDDASRQASEDKDDDDAFDDPMAPSTRRLESSGKIPYKRPGRGRANDPAMSIPTPLMVEVDELQKIHKDIDRARAEGSAREEAGKTPKAMPSAPVVLTPSSFTPTPLAKAGNEKEGDNGKKPQAQVDIPTVRRTKFKSTPPVETIATRPFETPVRAFDRASLPTAEKQRRSRTLYVGVAFVVLALGGFAAWRARAGSSNDATGKGPPSTSTTPTNVTTTGTESPTQPATNVTAPPVTAMKSAGVRDLVAPPGSSIQAPLPSISVSAPVATGKAAMILLGDPGTRVSVDGTSRGPCPARVELSPGQHDVQFTFEPTGESRGEKVTLKGGDRITVRAEFTGATPTVKIQR